MSTWIFRLQKCDNWRKQDVKTNEMVLKTGVYSVRKNLSNVKSQGLNVKIPAFLTPRFG